MYDGPLLGRTVRTETYVRTSVLTCKIVGTVWLRAKDRARAGAYAVHNMHSVAQRKYLSRENVTELTRH